MRKIVALSTLLLSLIWPSIAVAKDYSVKSPDGLLEIKVNTDNYLTYSLYYDGRLLVDESKISLTLEDGKTLGEKPVVAGRKTRTESEKIISPFYKVNSFDINYNELNLSFKGNFGVVFRAYDEGAAYRFYTTFKNPVTIQDELAEFNFDNDYTFYYSYSTAAEGRDPFAMAFQNLYEITPLSEANPEKISFLPVTVDYGNELKLTILESDLEAYPGMFVKTQDNHSVKGVFAPYPARMDYHRWRKMTYVAERENFIARTEGSRSYPWRVMSVTSKDTQMPVNHLVYALASPNRIGDYRWVQTGKVSWEWWNDWGITDVDFKAGINTETYKYYIDFASSYNIPFIILDEGWYDPTKGDILNVVPDVDLEELIRYGQSKQVGIVLWAVFNVVDEVLEEVCKKYADMGIKGFKVDFLDRDDQTAVEMVYRLAEETAKHKLILDLHGLYKPTGINRTYPHIINFEAVFGMEEMKWSPIEKDMVTYDVIMPYIRMMAGPVDYTPGAMRNASKRNFKDIYSNPMSQGTRCHQLAMYIVHDSPITMLADNPTAYMKEPEYTAFIAGIPDTGFDETKVLQGKIGEYIITARRVGSTWYIGGMTNWDPREINLDFSFLETGKNYNVVLYKDGINADRQASDYKMESLTIKKGDNLSVQMMSGGGFALRIQEE